MNTATTIHNRVNDNRVGASYRTFTFAYSIHCYSPVVLTMLRQIDRHYKWLQQSSIFIQNVYTNLFLLHFSSYFLLSYFCVFPVKFSLREIVISLTHFLRLYISIYTRESYWWKNKEKLYPASLFPLLRMYKAFILFSSPWSFLFRLRLAAEYRQPTIQWLFSLDKWREVRVPLL